MGKWPQGSNLIFSSGRGLRGQWHERRWGREDTPPPFARWILLKSLYTAHVLGGAGLCSVSLRAEYLCKLFGILSCEKFVLHLFIQSFISVFTCGYLFYTLGYNPVLCYFVQIVSALAVGLLFSWLLCPFDMPHQCRGFEHSLFYSLQALLGSSCVSPTPA